MSNCNKICEKSIYSFPTNNLSTKMIQAQALKQNKNSKQIRIPFLIIFMDKWLHFSCWKYSTVSIFCCYQYLFYIPKR